MNQSLFIQLFVYSLLFLIIFSIILQDQDKKLRIAAHGLDIDPQYIKHLRRELLLIYLNHPEMVKRTNGDFYLMLRRQQPFLCSLIYYKVAQLIEVDKEQEKLSSYQM